MRGSTWTVTCGGNLRAPRCSNRNIVDTAYSILLSEVSFSRVGVLPTPGVVQRTERHTGTSMSPAGDVKNNTASGGEDAERDAPFLAFLLGLDGAATLNHKF